MQVSLIRQNLDKVKNQISKDLPIRYSGPCRYPKVKHRRNKYDFLQKYRCEDDCLRHGWDFTTLQGSEWSSQIQKFHLWSLSAFQATRIISLARWIIPNSCKSLCEISSLHEENAQEALSEIRIDPIL